LGKCRRCGSSDRSTVILPLAAQRQLAYERRLSLKFNFKATWCPHFHYYQPAENVGAGVADKATERDGPFSSNTTFPNAEYYSPISSSNPLIELPVNMGSVLICFFVLCVFLCPFA
jgi:hypothetical protein